ncbi:MAG: NifU family protein [Chloroflexi bacterium]|nr:NifU family protein [Chloroflexota bacterium]
MLGQGASPPPPAVHSANGAGHGHEHGHEHAAGSSSGDDLTGANSAEVYEGLQVAVAAGLERLDDLPEGPARDAVFDLLDAVDGLHREGLSHLLAGLDGLGVPGLAARLLTDPVVRSLLELYDLAPADPRAEVESALREAHPYLESHGGHLEVLGIDDGRVTVSLSGSCETCPGSSVTLRRVVEEALREQVSWFRELVVEEPPIEAPNALETIEPVLIDGSGRRPLRRPRWVQVADLSDLVAGELRIVRPEGLAVILTLHSGEVYAYADGCPPGSPLTLQLAQLDGTELICPWHGCRYDVRTGRRTDGDGRLAVYPVAVREAGVLLALGTEEVSAA